MLQRISAQLRTECKFNVSILARFVSARLQGKLTLITTSLDFKVFVYTVCASILNLSDQLRVLLAHCILKFMSILKLIDNLRGQILYKGKLFMVKPSTKFDYFQHHFMGQRKQRLTGQSESDDCQNESKLKREI